MKTTISVAVVLIIACAVAGLMIMQHQAAKEPVPPTVGAVRQPEPARTMEEALPAAPPEEPSPVVAQAVSPPTPSPAPQTAEPAAPVQTGTKNAKAPAQAGQAG